MLFLFNLKLALIEKSKIINHMFVRIVKLSFLKKHSLFLENFDLLKRIRCAPGNRLLELYQDRAKVSFLHIAIGIPKKI
jgi:hypothetical protein